MKSLPPIAITDIDDPTVRETVISLAETYNESGETIKFLKSQQDENKAELNNTLDGTPWQGRKIIGDTFRMAPQTKKTKTIDPLILLQNGVSMEVIKLATKINESKPFWTITSVKEKDEEDDE